MASKYEQLVGQVVNGVYVVDYKREPRTSKTGREYKVGRLTVAYETSKHVTLNIGISSFNKWSFIKNLNKLNGVNSSSSKKQQTKTKTKTKQQTKTTSKTKQQTTTSLADDNFVLAAYAGCLFAQQEKHKFFKQVQTFVLEFAEQQQAPITPQQRYDLHKLCMDNWYYKVFDNMYVFERECKQQYGQRLGSIVATAMGEEWVTLIYECNDYIYNVIAQVNLRFTRQQTTTNIKDNEFTVEFKGCKTVREVKQVYRRLAKLHHSDTGGSDEKFKLVHEAYETAMKKVA